MTARENMGFGLKMTTDLSTAEIDERVEESAEMMGISKLLDSKPGEMSGGQQQRVALGRAIVRDPEVFLMDEPLSNLDAKLRTQMRTELQSLQSQFGVTTIYVTHDQTEAMTMSDRIAVLDDGELQQVGTPLECYHEPANEFVAGFIGSPSSAAPVVSTVWWRPTRRPRGRLPLVLPDEPLDGRRADRRAARDGTARSLPRGPPVRRRGRAALRDVRAERITVPGIREPDGSESRGAVRLGSRTGPATTTRSTAAA
jgi:ABC-type proline/glycine betaine transport system ATPase subunit